MRATRSGRAGADAGSCAVGEGAWEGMIRPVPETRGVLREYGGNTGTVWFSLVQGKKQGKTKMGGPPLTPLRRAARLRGNRLVGGAGCVFAATRDRGA